MPLFILGDKMLFLIFGLIIFFCLNALKQFSIKSYPVLCKLQQVEKITHSIRNVL